MTRVEQLMSHYKDGLITKHELFYNLFKWLLENCPLSIFIICKYLDPGLELEFAEFLEDINLRVAKGETIRFVTGGTSGEVWEYPKK